MKLNDLFEDGRIVKGVNTTPDVQPGETQRQSKKFGNKINKAGEPPLLHAKARKNSYVHVLDNLGLTESYYKPAPEDTLGIKRADMPQVHKDHYPELIDYLNKEGGNHAIKTVDAKTLKAVQGEFSDAGIEKMINNTDDSKGTTRKKPLIVSSDNYIVDGHHRWLAAYNLDQDIPIMQFNIPIRQLLQLIRDFDHTTYKDIYNENMSVVGTERQKEADRKKLQPGTDAWFKHWFSRPYLTRSELTHLKEEVRNLRKRKGVNDEKENRKRRHDRNNRSDECSSKR